MLKRSPLHWEFSAKSKGRLEMYVGINDGYEGSVPITHAISFYNKIVRAGKDIGNVIAEQDALKLISREVQPTGEIIDGRDVLFRKDAGNVSLVVFQGGHEILVGYSSERIKKLVED
jgi:hypothetical protein